MEMTISKLFRAKKTYFYLIEDFKSIKDLYSMLNTLMKALNFESYVFSGLEGIKEALGYLPILLNVLFFLSKDGNDLFIIDYININDKMVLILYHYSKNDQNDIDSKISIIFAEIAKNYNITYKLINFFEYGDNKLSKFLLKNLNLEFLKTLREYSFDRSKIDLDKYFIDPSVFKVSQYVLNGRQSELGIDDIRYMKTLEKNNFLKIFIIFRCSSNNTSIFQMNNLDNLEILLESFRCPICSKKLAEESKEINLTISPFYEIYFKNYIWLRNVVFDNLLSFNVRIYEYDNNVYLLQFFDLPILFVFCNYENLFSAFSYYKDMEILNLPHAFFWVINYNDDPINYSMLDKFSGKISVININKDSLVKEKFESIIEQLKEKIKYLYSMKQLENITLFINYSQMFEHDFQFEEKERIEVSQEIEKAETKEEIVEFFEEKVGDKIEDKKEMNMQQDVKELKSELVDLIEMKKEDQEMKTEELILEEPYELGNGPIMEEKVKPLEIIDIENKKESNVIQREESSSIEYFEELLPQQMQDLTQDKLQQDESIEMVEETKNTEIQNIIEEIDNILDNTFENESQNIAVSDIHNKSKVALEETGVISLDELLKQVKTDFKNTLEKDLAFKDFTSVFYHLLAGMSKEKLAFLPKNIAFFNQKMASEFIEYYVLIYSPRGVNMEPKNEMLFMTVYQPILNSIYLMKDYYLDDREVYNFFINRDSLFFNLLFNAAPNIICSSFVIKSMINGEVISSYPAELREFKIDIIRRIEENLNNLKLSNAIENFGIFDLDFEPLIESDIKPSVVSKTFDYYQLFANYQPYVWGFGKKDEGLFIAFRYRNALILVNKKDFSYNDLISLYNGLYLLEIL